jgi:hypothetical protein
MKDILISLIEWVSRGVILIIEFVYDTISYYIYILHRFEKRRNYFENENFKRIDEKFGFF